MTRIKRIILIVSVLPLLRGQDVLDCNFDLGNSCQWFNAADGSEDDTDWRFADSVNVDGFHSIPRTLTGTGEFAYVQGSFLTTRSPSAKAWLQSPVIQGLSAPATLTFNYWKAAVPPILQVCTRDAGNTQLRCLDTISGLGSQNWVQRVVTVPANPVSFQVILAASNFNTELDTVGVDDVVFVRSQNDVFGPFSGSSNSDPFATSNSGSNSFVSSNQYENSPDSNGLQHITATFSSNRAPNFASFGNQPLSNQGPTDTVVQNQAESSVTAGTSRILSPNSVVQSIQTDQAAPSLPVWLNPAVDAGVCSAVACEFRSGLCGWFNDFTANFDWQIYTGGRGGIPNNDAHDSYMFVSGDGRHPGQTAALRSAEFVVPKGAFLEVEVLMTNQYIGRLAIYRDSQASQNVLWQTLGNRLVGEGWQKVHVALVATDDPISVLIVADTLTQGTYIGIDTLKLVDASGAPVTCAAAPPKSSIRHRQPVLIDPQPVFPVQNRRFDIPQRQSDELPQKPIRVETLQFSTQPLADQRRRQPAVNSRVVDPAVDPRLRLVDARTLELLRYLLLVDPFYSRLVNENAHQQYQYDPQPVRVGGYYPFANPFLGR